MEICGSTKLKPALAGRTDELAERPKVAVVDMVWGMVLCASVSGLTYLASSKLGT